ncbi:MAG: ABC transporter permease [Pseudomonadota bacterium]
MLGLAPAVLLTAFLLLIPLGLMLHESVQTYTPGRIGSDEAGPLTLENFREILTVSYLSYFTDTFLLSMIAAIVAVIVCFPLAYRIARLSGRRARAMWIFFLMSLLFVSALAKVYAISVSFGPVGILPYVTRAIGISQNSLLAIQGVVIIGLLHYLMPIVTLSLIGAVQGVNPRLLDASQSLGASQLETHLLITLPLCGRALLSTFLFATTLSISAFVIPLILGRGRVAFLSNLIYTRFGEISNYPSGAAFAIVLLSLVAAALACTTFLTRSRRRKAAA